MKSNTATVLETQVSDPRQGDSFYRVLQEALSVGKQLAGQHGITSTRAELGLQW